MIFLTADRPLACLVVHWLLFTLPFVFVRSAPHGPRSHPGKLPDNEVVMAHPSVSRSHALLVVDKTLGAFLIDLGASNGSFVDGRVSKRECPLPLSQFLFDHTTRFVLCLYVLLKKANGTLCYGCLIIVSLNHMCVCVFFCRVAQTLTLAANGKD